MKIGFENKAISEIKKYCGRYGVSSMELSMHLRVVSIRVYEILNGKRRVTVDTDLRLCKFFKLKRGHFLSLQNDYDFLVEEERLKSRLKEIKTVDEIVKKGD